MKAKALHEFLEERGDILLSQDPNTKPTSEDNLRINNDSTTDSERDEAIEISNSTIEEDTLLLVTNSDTTRGLHIEGLNTVVIFGYLPTSDEYLHVSGRVGRYEETNKRGKGNVISFLPYADVKKLSLYKSQLNIDFHDLLDDLHGPKR